MRDDDAEDVLDPAVEALLRCETAWVEPPPDLWQAVESAIRVDDSGERRTGGSGAVR